MEKILNSPFVPRKKTSVGQTGFDTEYIHIAIVDAGKKTGEGDEDFVVYKKVITTTEPIQEVVDRDRQSVGVENILAQYIRNDCDPSILPVDDGKGDVDLVGAPEDLMQLKQVAIDAEKKYAALPDDLKNGMDMTSFVNSMSQEKFDAFVKAMADRASSKEKETSTYGK